jgi:hypothetical protein
MPEANAPSIICGTLGLKSITHPCILREVVDRHTLGHMRPLRSMGHYNNLFDRTRTVARGKTLNTESKVYSPYRARMSEIRGMKICQHQLHL